MKDQKAFLNKEFTTKSISENVLKKIPLEQNAKVFSDTKLVFESKTTEDDKTITRKQIHTFSSQGNGLFQHDIEFISNEITNGRHFSIDYKGLQDIKWTFANPLRDFSESPYEIKEVQRWDALGTKVGEMSVIDFKWNPVLVIVSPDDGQTRCTVTKISEAKEIHPKLTGQVRYLDCDHAKSGNIFSRNKKAYLVDLGFAIPIEIVSARFKIELKLIDVINP